MMESFWSASFVFLYFLRLMVVPVLVMDFRHVGMIVLCCFMGMLMAVLPFDFVAVAMSVMPAVVAVPVLVGFLRMDMEVLMLLCDCKIGSDNHDDQRDQERIRQGVPEHYP